MTFPGHPFTRTSGLAVLLAGISSTAASAADRYWDPLNNNSYVSTGYTTYTAATVVWNTTNAAFDTSPVNSANLAWAPGDDAFINLSPEGIAMAAPGATWFIRIGTAAPAVHNVTYDSSTPGSLLSLLANSTAGTNANMGLTPGANGASTWTVGAEDTLRLSSGGNVGGSTNVGAVNLVNAAGVNAVDLVKEGAGRMHIQSTGSSFIGNVRINAGLLQINGNGSLGNALNDVYIADGATLTANNNATIASSRAIFLGPSTGTGTANLDAQGSFTFTIDAWLANQTGGVGGFNKTNTGTVVLSNLGSSYTGATTISAGTLRIPSLADGGVASPIGASTGAASNLIFGTGSALHVVGVNESITNRLFTIGGSASISNNSALPTSTLAFTNTGAVVNATAGDATFTLGGSNAGENVFAPSLTDNGPNVLNFVKGGAGRWILTDTHTFTGVTTIGDGSVGGTLEFNGALAGAGGIVDVTAGNRLSGTGTIARNVSVNGTLSPGSASAPLGTLTVNGSVTLNAGSGLSVSLGGSAASKVTGITNVSVDSASTVTVALNAANLPAGAAYDILEYSGSLAGAFSPSVAVAGLTGLTSRIAFGLDYGTPQKVRLTQTGQAKSVTWTGNDGASPSTWDVDGVANWNSGGVEKFFDLDTVTFGDSAMTRIVDVVENVSPSAIVMNNTETADYFLGASTGTIIGPASFTKEGSAKLTISGPHAFTGPFSINGGTVATAIVNDTTIAGPLGQGTLIFGGGTLEYTGATAATSRPIQFAAGGGTVNIPDAVDLTFSGSITGAGGLTKIGSGTLRLPGTNGYDGPVVVTAGVLKLGNNDSLGTTAAGAVVIAGAALDLAATATTMSLPQNEVITVAGHGVDFDADAIPDGALVNFGTANAQNALKKVVLAGDATFGGSQRFDVRIAGTAEAGFVAGTDAYLKGNGFNFTKAGSAILGLAGVGETDLANIEVKGGTLILHDAGVSDLAMMLASDTTLGRVSDGAGNFYKATIQPGATLQFFNSDGTRSKDIIANGVGADATISMNSNVGAAHTLTLNRGITANGGLTLNSANAAETTLLVSGVISDGASPGLLTKTGGGAVVLASANTFTGGTTINAGRVRLGDNAALGTGPLTIAGGGISSVGNTARQIANPVTLAGNATFGDLSENGAITIVNQVNFGNVGRNVTFNADVKFAAGMTAVAPGGLTQKLGTGTLTLGAGASTSGGVIEIRGGALVLESGAQLSAGDAIRVMANTAGGNATFTMAPGSSLVIGLGTANLRIGHESATITDGINIANIAGDLNFAAPTTGGNVQLGSDSAIAQLNLLTGGRISTRSIGLAGQTPVGAVTEVNFDGGELRALGDNDFFFPAVLSAAKVKAGGAIIDTNGFGVGFFQPLVHDVTLGVSPDGGLTKTGVGTLTLNAVNDYNGNTNVNGGTLVVSPTGSIAGSALTTVNVGGTLSGAGRVGQLKLNGGTLAPGPSTGILTVTDHLEFAGGIAAFEINGLSPGAAHDQLAIGEFAESIISITAPTELSLSLGYFPVIGDSVLLIDNDSINPITTTALFTVNGNPVPNGGSFDAGGYSFELRYDGGDGNDLSVTVVPEPGSALLILGGLGMTVVRRRRGHADR